MKKAKKNWIGEACSETEENLRKNNSKRANFTHLLILPFSVFPLCAHTCLVKGNFLMLHSPF